MSSGGLTGEVAESGSSMPWRFVAFWTLSFATSALLMSVLRMVNFSVAQYDLAIKAALLRPIPIWFLIAYQQFRLIPPHLRRSYLWLFATFIGGNLGVFVGGLTQLQTSAALEYYAYQSAAASDYGRIIPFDWIFAVAPALSLTVGCLAAAAVLGFL